MVGFTGEHLTKPPRIFTGTVFEIYPEEGSVDIKVGFPDDRFYSKVPYASAFKDKGLAGFDFVPTRGCTVLLLEHASEDSGAEMSAPIVIGFMAPPGKSIGARRELLPSDVQVSGKYGNNLLLRSNGDAYLVGDARNLIAFITTEELTKLRTTNFEHEHPGGNVRWMIDGEAQGGAVAYLHGIKRNMSDDKPYLSVSAGTDAAGGLEIRMAAEGGEMQESANPIFINDVPVGCAFRVGVDPLGNVGISSLGMMSVESIGPMNIASTSAINLSAPQIAFTSAVGGMSVVSTPGSPTQLVIPDGIEIIAPHIKITQGTTHLVSSSDEEGHSKKVITEDLYDWIVHHRHFTPTMTNPLNSPTGFYGLTTKPLNTSVITSDPVYNAINGTFQAEVSSGAIPQATAIQGILASDAQYTADRETAITKETKVR
jgi:hypothetical protein